VKFGLVPLLAAASLFHAAAAVLCCIPLGVVYAVLVIPRVSTETAFAGVFLLCAAAFVLSCCIYRAVLRRFLNRNRK
jgi:hypothetical protein